ncbi:TetR/AcrR family transcriptional regulator [Streptacidiphilus carbonis]|uniref:TetR/AcrR family transcriptional regulator n=1 Tax=Streptacidiphilus carbonis TaxID=105422 RepID=UPI0005A5E78A|nr:TetR/AcrR family transcriptional regulator C-terminal domain-containing protein [Streptacidiphilus carbonis]
MTTQVDGGKKAVRGSLSREQVLRGALDYVDEHGLDQLSMHKLGASLGVKAMSLYKHVTDKDDLLDGIVGLMWAEIPAEPPTDDWREAIRRLAASLRDLVHRHPDAAPLLISRQGLRERPLLICHGLMRLMRDGGVPEKCAAALLRTVFPFGLGYALAELSLPASPDQGPCDEIGFIRRATDLLPAEVSNDLIRTALLVCGDCEMTAQFHFGVDLMIGGLNSYLESLSPGMAEVPEGAS